MNLYLISQDKNNNWDTFDSAVVAAENENEARLIHPYNEKTWNGEADGYWVAAKDVEVELIGVALDGTEKGVILSSFNAG